MPNPFSARLTDALEKASQELLRHRNTQGHWEGQLSSSALSTATAVTALAIAGRAGNSTEHHPRIEAGLDWLAANANPDGGWGDTLLSLSNLSTTTLCWAAFDTLPLDRHRTTVANALQWLVKQVGSTNPTDLAAAVIQRYGKDRTFSVPILTHCALAGKLGQGKDAWRDVIPLPFELAACPHSWFAALRLPVVSYALPALIAIGQARHHHSPSRNPIVRLIRNATRERTLRTLSHIQPKGGGFLEATPLTSFVVMSLAGSRQENHPVTAEGVKFLLKSARPDGSWPIDTNLATWVTTLSINALQPTNDPNRNDDGEDWNPVLQWLLQQQYREEHPYTHAAPGGWAWTDLPGGVPDADDTAGALLALHQLAPDRSESLQCAGPGIDWLIGLQNRDGGIPTFCRGWGTLPFDRSSADITAHALRAWAAWHDQVSPRQQARIAKALDRAVHYLISTQRTNGSWLPLWFGNQHVSDDANPTYGTTKVLLAFAEISGSREGSFLSASTRRALIASALSAAAWLMGAQNPDGSWGGGPGVRGSTEETALAIEALGYLALHQDGAASRSRAVDALEKGAGWLIDRVEDGTWKDPAPIGFYFARLWYFETLYPLIFTAAALRMAQRVLQP